MALVEVFVRLVCLATVVAIGCWRWVVLFVGGCVGIWACGRAAECGGVWLYSGLFVWGLLVFGYFRSSSAVVLCGVDIRCVCMFV